MSLKKNRTIRFLGRKILELTRRLQSYPMLFLVKYFPGIHAIIEGKRQNFGHLIRKPNIKDPKYFGEKMLYLQYFLYNKSPLVAKCYNKFEVRDYLIYKGCERYLNQLYGVWDSIEEIPWDDLPEEFVMKVANGYSGHVFKRKGEPFSCDKAIASLKQAMSLTSYRFKITGGLFAYGTKQKIICEKLLKSNFGHSSLEDYKFFCFHGEPKYVVIMWDRQNSGETSYSAAFFDIDMNDRHDLEYESMENPPRYIIPARDCLDEMIQLAKTLSSDFPFVRVDFYLENNRPVFGELTFTPFHAQTKQSMIEMGELIDLDRLDDYKEILL